MTPAAVELPPPLRYECHGLRGATVAGYESFDPENLPWELAAGKMELPAEMDLAKRSRSRIVLAVEFNGQTLYVKRARARTLPRKASAWLRGPKTRREWEVGRQFLAAGFLVPEPVLYAARDPACTYLVTKGLPTAWMSVSRWVGQHGLSPQILTDLAQFSRWLHDWPAYHGDWRADHVFKTDAEETAPLRDRYAFMDLDGASLGVPVTRRQREDALAQMIQSLHRHGVTLDQVRYFVSQYEGTNPIGLKAESLDSRARSRRRRS